VDHGDRRTGLALPLEIIEERDPERLVEAILERARARGTELILVGLPLAPDGGLGARGGKARAFALRLARRAAPIAVAGLDERNTTGLAHERLRQAGMKAARRRRRGVDAVAALVLVESWLAGEEPISLEGPEGRGGE
jgi:putative Holliday junction resolvase